MTSPRRRLTLALLGFGSLSALAGGVVMALQPHGSEVVPLALLAPTAFDTFLIPGLLLAGVVGGLALAATVAVWRKSPWAIDLTLLAGGAMTIWIVAEVAQLRTLSWLQALYFAQGAAVTVLGFVAAFRSESARHRWVAAVTLAELAGYQAPAAVMAFGVPMLVVAAGFCEGLLLGAGQALMLPVRVNRPRFALLTGLGAAVAWSVIFGATRLMHGGGGPAVALAMVLASVGLFAVPVAQWLELKSVAWVGWTMLAWVIALPLSFLPSPLMEASTPRAAQLALLACGGALMAFAMANVTWLGVKRLTRAPAAASTASPRGPTASGESTPPRPAATAS